MGTSYNTLQGISSAAAARDYGYQSALDAQKYENEAVIQQMITSMQGTNAANVAKIHEAGADVRDVRELPYKTALANKANAEAEGQPMINAYHQAMATHNQSAADQINAGIPAVRAASDRAGSLMDMNLKGLELENQLREGTLAQHTGIITQGKSYLDAFNKEHPELAGQMGKLQSVFDSLLGKPKESNTVVATPPVATPSTTVPLSPASVITSAQNGINLLATKGVTPYTEGITHPLIDPVDMVAGAGSMLAKIGLGTVGGMARNILTNNIGGTVTRGTAAGVARPIAGKLAVNVARTRPSYSYLSRGYGEVPWTPGK